MTENKTAAYMGSSSMLAEEHILIFLFAIIFCSGQTFTIMLHNIFCTLVFHWAFVAGSDVYKIPQRPQSPARWSLFHIHHT
jgi:hypothetical protein